MEPRASPPRVAAEYLTIALFLGAIAAPAIDSWVRPDLARSTLPELRTPAPRPVLEARFESWWTFAPRCDAWWRDGFGLRDRLIRLHNALSIFVLPAQPNPTAILGPERWLFVTTNRALEADLGLFPLSADGLEAWVRMLSARRAWCESRGILPLFAYVPAKSLIYPEHLPRGWKAIGENRVRQIAARLGPDWKDTFVDLLDSQLAERRNDRPAAEDFAWYPLGSHWQARGAFAGYRELAERIAAVLPSIHPLEREQFQFARLSDQGDTWANRLYLGDCLRHTAWGFETQVPLGVEDLGPVSKNELSRRYRGPDPSRPKLIVFLDSMAPPLRTWLASHFSESLWIWQQGFDVALVEAERPDVVLFLYSDRALVMEAPFVTAAETGGELDRAFASASRVLLRIDVARSEPALIAQGRTRIAPDGDALAIETRTGADTLLVPAFEFPEQGAPLLHVEIESPEDTYLDILYKTRADPSYARKRSYQVALQRGRNDVYVELLDRDLIGELCVRPGRAAGVYRLRALEVRAREP